MMLFVGQIILSCDTFTTQTFHLLRCSITLTCGLLRSNVLPLSPGGCFWDICCLIGGRQASRGAAALLSLGTFSYGFLLQEHSAATEAMLAPQPHQWPTPAIVLINQTTL